MRFVSVKRVFKTLIFAVVAVSIACGRACEARADQTIRLDAGTVIPVRLNDALSSLDSRKGDTFTTTVKTVDTEHYGLPPGTKVDGLIIGARPHRDKKPGVIEVSFHTSVERRSDGRLIAKPSHQNDRLTYAGYGAGAGLIVGLLTRRPFENAVLGGLLGYGFSALQKGHTDAKDVILKPGTKMGVRIDRGSTLASYDDIQGSHFHRDSPNSYRVSMDRQDYSTVKQVGTNNPSDRIYRQYDRTDATDVGVVIDDRDVRFNSTARPTITRNDVVLVPASPVLRAAKIRYVYDGRTQTLYVTGTSESVRIAVGSSIAVVNGTRHVRMEALAQRIDGTVYVPMKFLSIAMGYDVRYDSPSRTVVLTSR
jgi:hypothetical protein